MKTLANEQLPADAGANNPSSVVCAANEARFESTNYSEPLTAYTTGWKDPANLEELLNFLAPNVPTGRRFEFKKAENAEAFLSETDDVRSIGSAFKRVEYEGATVNEKTLNKGLTIRIDRDEQLGPNWEERAVDMLMQRLLRNELRRAVGVLDGASTNANKTWNPGATTLVNPIKDLRDMLITATDESGVRPNRLAFGETALAYFYDLVERQADKLGFVADAQMLGRKLGANVREIEARYQSSVTAKSKMIGTKIYAFYAEDGVMRDDPTHIKRFVSAPEGGGGMFRVYHEEHSKYVDISVEHYSNIVATSTVGIRNLTIANS
jgi:hypothetical protein